MRLPTTLLVVALLFAGCGDDPEPGPTPSSASASSAAVDTAPPPAYPVDEGLGALLPAEPEAAQEAAEAAAKRAEEVAARAAAKAAPQGNAPTPAAKRSTPDPSGLPAISLTKATLSKRVVDRAPVEVGTTFAEGSEVFCFNTIDNPGGTRRGLRHDWYFGETRKSSIKLSVHAKTWRTWSSRPVYGRGAWRVDVVDDTGRLLQSLPFVVE